MDITQLFVVDQLPPGQIPRYQKNDGSQAVVLNLGPTPDRNRDEVLVPLIKLRHTEGDLNQMKEDLILKLLIYAIKDHQRLSTTSERFIDTIEKAKTILNGHELVAELILVHPENELGVSGEEFEDLRVLHCDKMSPKTAIVSAPCQFVGAIPISPQKRGHDEFGEYELFGASVINDFALVHIIST